MGIVFGEYDLLANSGLFDAAYYIRAYPDVAKSNVDPLMHYLERGCREGRNPSAGFDTAHYLKLCESLGEAPTNALIHYLTVGMSRGLSPTVDRQRQRKPPRPSPFPMPGKVLKQTPAISPSGPETSSANTLLYIDIPRVVDGIAVTTAQGGLSIVGWGYAKGGASNIQISLDGLRMTTARCRLRRPDVAAAHPELEDGLMSGFAAHLPAKVLATGRHDVSVAMHDHSGRTTQIDFLLDVQEPPDHRGPWALRRKMTQAEVDCNLLSLGGMPSMPRFRIYLVVDEVAKDIVAARRTVDSLMKQKYRSWNWQPVQVGSSAARPRSTASLAARILDGFGDPSIGTERRHREQGRALNKPGPVSRAGNSRSFVLKLIAGDELGCDALLEFAVSGALYPHADLFYSDELRIDPVDGKMGPFFKPAWSPDLHLSTNYLGRAWCADRRLLRRAGVSNDALGAGAGADYDLTLRLTEAAKRIVHIPKVLHMRRSSGAGGLQQGRRALANALRRRGIAGEVHFGYPRGTYRIKRSLRIGRVSIIIPTCAADGLIKTCLETIRAHTSHPDYQIVCIENIPVLRQEWKGWLCRHADVAIEETEPFNWSRYNNKAARHADGEYFVFLNDDVEIIEAGWLDALVEQVQRPEVGVVGPRLLYPDRTVQQAGMMLDRRGRGLHAFRHLTENDPGYFGLATTQRNVIGVTGACLVTRRDTYEALGGFDEAHAIINNDLDFCLRARRKGLVNVYVPQSTIIHHELASRSHLGEVHDSSRFFRMWRNVIAAGDPYFNPNLSRNHEALTVEREPFQTVHSGHPLFAHSAVHRILVLKLDHIGDCVTAFPAIRRLKHHFPLARISVLAARATLGIWGSNPMIAQTLEFNFFHARSGNGKIEVTPQQLRELRQQLALNRFDLAIDLRKQPDTRHLLEYSGADVLVGFDTQGRFPWLDVALEWDEDVPLRAKHGHVSDDLIALVEAVGVQSRTDRVPLLQWKGRLSLPAAQQRRVFAKPLICVHVAAGSPMRQWPPGHFAELVSLLLSQHDCHIALIGGKDESDLAEQVSASVGNPPEVFNLTGCVDLSELPQLFLRSVLFIGNNSGPQHVAAGLGVPTVGIHSGVVDAHEWGPLGPRAVAVRRDMSCSPCFIEHANDCPRGLECLVELAVADVYAVCKRFLLSPNDAM